MSAREIYYAVRRSITWCCDRIGCWCDDRTVDTYAIRSRTVRRAVVTLLQGVGGVAHVVKLLPRLDAFRLQGPAWQVVYVGDTLFMHELEHLLFPDGVSLLPMKRVAATGIRRFVDREIRGANLVVCALPRLWPRCWRPRAPLAFTAPVFVNARLNTHAPLEDLLRGTRRAAFRKQLKKMQRVGYTVRTTRTRAEFDRFHAEMYRPHVERRHGSRALLTPPDVQWKGWIEPGGSLLLVEREGRSLAGAFLRQVGMTMISGEEGVAQTVEADQLQACLQVTLKAAMIEHARSAEATDLLMGWSLARCGERGVLEHKLRWGAVVIPGGRSLHPYWTFLFASIPESLRSLVNLRGLVTFVKGCPCVVSIGAPTEASVHTAEPVGRILVVGPESPGAVVEVRPPADLH